MSSSSSTSGAYGQYGTYQSSKEVVDLCAQGYFTHSSSNSASFDSSSGFGHGQSSGSGDGTWKVISNIDGQAVLQLTFNSGNINELVIKYKDGKTFLDGERFFRTYGDDGPFCN